MLYLQEQFLAFFWLELYVDSQKMSVKCMKVVKRCVHTRSKFVKSENRQSEMERAKCNIIQWKQMLPRWHFLWFLPCTELINECRFMLVFGIWWGFYFVSHVFNMLFQHQWEGMVRQSHWGQMGWNTGMGEGAILANPLALETQNWHNGNSLWEENTALSMWLAALCKQSIDLSNFP